MGIDPTAAALCSGSCPRLSFTLALHSWAMSVFTVLRFDFDVAR